MADLEQMKKALRAAHAAGDTVAAKRIAAMIKGGSAQSPMQAGLAKMSDMTRNPRLVDQSPATGGFADGDPRNVATPVPPAPPQGTNLADQFSSGLNEGIARFAGVPVDLMTGALNLGGAGVNALLGTEIPAIENPVGGSGTFTSAMDPLISDADPQTAGQRYARRGGQEIGFGIPAAMTGAAIPGYGAAAREAMAPYMAASVAGDAGAALAGQTAREVAPNSPIADLIASLLGGGGASYAASRMTPALAATPTLDEMKSKASGLWEKVQSAPETLTDSATAGLEAATRGALPTSQLAPRSYPAAFAAAEDVGTLQNPRVFDVEEARRIIGDAVAGDPKEARVGVAMKKAIEDYMGTLKPADLQGGSADETLDALAAARKTTHQTKKADAVINKEMRGESRAATTGTGGNEVNAIRQNIRTLFDKERDPTLSGARQGFSPDEMKAMDTVVFGDTKSNIARLLGRMAPTSGALPMTMTGLGGASGATATLATGNPFFAIPAIAGGVGELSKAAAEKMTKDQIAVLLATILNGGKAPGKSAARTATEQAIVNQLLSTSAQ